MSAFFSIIPAYIVWHYGEAYRDIFRVWTNFVWFLYNLFSIKILLKTIFSPWRRIQERKDKPGFHPEELAEIFFINLVMRFVGAGVRLIIIIVGTVTVLLAAIFGILFFVAWTLLPVILVASPVYGIFLAL